MEQFNLDEFYRSIAGFWDATSPILFAHIAAFVVLRFVGTTNWHTLERIEYFLNSNSYQRWKRILDEFDLRSKAFFVLPCVSIISETVSSRKIVSKTGQRSKGNVSNASHQPE